MRVGALSPCKRGGRGGTEVSVKITCDEGESTLFRKALYVAIMEKMLI